MTQTRKKSKQTTVVSAAEAVKAGGSRTPWLAMVLLSILFVALAAGFNYTTPYTTPMGLHERDGGMANPDEHDHFDYIRTLATTGRLPVFEKGGASTEAHQPPLYYLLAVPFYKTASSEASSCHAVRWLSTLFGLGLFWAVFFFARALYPEARSEAVAAAACAAFLPMNLSLSASVSNDALTNLLFACGLALLAGIARSAANGRDLKAMRVQVTALGIVLGLGMWTKSSTAMLFIVALAGWSFLSHAGVMGLKQGRLGALISLGLGLCIALPWLIRNQLLYGDPLAQHAFVQVLAGHNFSPGQIVANLGLTWYLKSMVGWTFASYWGVFDSMNLFLPWQVYALFATLGVLSIAGYCLFVARRPMTAPQAAVWAAGGVLITLVALFFVTYNVDFFQAQGRYWFGALAPFSLAFVIGLETLATGKYGKMLIVSFVVLLVLIDVASLSLISAAYAPKGLM